MEVVAPKIIIIIIIIIIIKKAMILYLEQRVKSLPKVQIKIFLGAKA